MASLPQGGVLPIQDLRQLIAEGALVVPDLNPTQLQPNSLDLRVGAVAHRVRYSFLPTNATVANFLKTRDLTLSTLSLDHPDGVLLEPGKIYIIPLRETLTLPTDVCAAANPKSSTGRLDILARLIVDHSRLFDAVPMGYTGPLYLEVVPRSFPIRLRADDRLAQLRLARGTWHQLSDETLAAEITQGGLICTDDGTPLRLGQLLLEDGVLLTAYVNGPRDATIGYVARKSTPVVDWRRLDHPRRPYWRYLPTPRGRDQLVLQPDEFYIFSSRERVTVPPHLCAEMVPYDPKSGELRTHYAGFFDSGFGYRGGGARVALEVRNLDVPFLLQDGQRLFRLRFFHNVATPEQLYGEAVGSNYQGQGLRLSKHFGLDRPEQSPQLPLWGPEVH